MKTFTATAGTRNNPISVNVEIPGAVGEMNPAQARQAARIAFGHTYGVTVSDGHKTYRLTQGGNTRLLHNDDLPGRPPLTDEPTERITVTLPASQVAVLRSIGDGNVSLGVRRAIEQL